MTGTRWARLEWIVLLYFISYIPNVLLTRLSTSDVHPDRGDGWHKMPREHCHVIFFVQTDAVSIAGINIAAKRVERLALVNPLLDTVRPAGKGKIAARVCDQRRRNRGPTLWAS